MNSNLQFALPDLPPGVDPATMRVVEPLHRALFSLFQQISDQLGQTYVEPSLYSTIPISALSKLNGLRRIYVLNNSGAQIAAGKFVYIDAAGSLQLSGTISATAPIGFITGTTPNGAYGEVVLSVGHIVSSGLTPGARYEAGASGALAAHAAGTAIAMALSATDIYVNIPMHCPTIAYGEMYATNISQTITVSASNTAYEITGGLTGGVVLRTTFGGSHYLQVTDAGKYKVSWSLTIDTATVGDEIEGGIMINGTAQSNATSHSSVSASSEGEAIAATGIITLAANDQVSLFVRNHTGARNIVMEHGSLVIERLTA